MSEQDYIRDGVPGSCCNQLMWLLLDIYKYISMGSLYIQLPVDIINIKSSSSCKIMMKNASSGRFWRNTTLWAIIVIVLAQIISTHKDKCNFACLSYRTLLTEIKLFERNSPRVFINEYGRLKQENKNKIIKYSLSINSGHKIA